jgi:hypothetical protein
MRMSEFEDPSANTGRFRAFVERGDEDVAPSRRRLPASPAVLIAVGVVIVAIIVVIAAVA